MVARKTKILLYDKFGLIWDPLLVPKVLYFRKLRVLMLVALLGSVPEGPTNFGLPAAQCACLAENLYEPEVV